MFHFLVSLWVPGFEFAYDLFVFCHILSQNCSGFRISNLELQFLKMIKIAGFVEVKWHV